MILRILHLSDFHFRTLEKNPVKSFNADVVTSSMLKAIESLIHKGTAIDLVIITGDIAFSGKKAEYDVAEEFFTRLREVTDLPNSRFYIVPGNHDVDRTTVKQRHIDTVYVYNTQDDITATLTDEDLFPILIKKFTKYNTFANIILGRKLFTENDYSYTKHLTIRKEKKAFSLNLLGLNSSLFAGYDGDDKQKLALGLHQVQPAIKKCEENALLTIAFFHHPFSCFHPVDQVAVNSITHNADILLHGHLHEPLNADTINAAGKLITIGAGAGFEQREHRNSFNLLEINPRTGQGSVSFYKYIHEHNCWNKNHDVNPHSKDGTFPFTLDIKDPDKKITQTAAPFTEAEEENFTPYLAWLKDECGYIDIRGLQVGSGRAHRFEIDQLYIPLTTSSRSKDPDASTRRKTEKASTETAAPVHLSDVLEHRYVTIIGDPGSGKTTFLRYIAAAFGNALAENDPRLITSKTGLNTLLFPVFIRVSELAEFILDNKGTKSGCPSSASDPRWMRLFLEDKNTALRWGFSRTFFDNKLKTGTCLLLLDGLDEAPDRMIRQNISSLVKNTIQANKHCRFVVTTRPLAYTGLVVLKNFTEYTIASLSEKAVHSFLKLWSETLFSGNLVKTTAENHYKDLAEALSRSQAIRRLALNPMMLTALAVIHWNQRRLPEQRAELYESIITWLLRSREEKPGRLTAEQCKPYLCTLAFAMQADSKGRQVRVGRRRACEILADLFTAHTDEESLARAEDFIAHEEVDSGIIVQRGGAVAFWHLTFQEYLAAKALGGKTDKEQKRLLINEKTLLSPEWKEVLLLLCGVLHEQGLDKLGTFFNEILHLQKGKKDLKDKARYFGLLGSMEHDLSPYQYKIDNPLYNTLKNDVRAVFDKDRALEIPVKIRCEAADALGQAGDPRFLKDQFVTIPGGGFLMGSQKKDPAAPNYDPGAWDDEFPVHKVKLTEYKISRYPVTVGEYAQFIEDKGYKKEKYWTAGSFGKFSEPDAWVKQAEFPTRPVVGVSWFEAMAYAAWKGCNLPTEAQWERAARGPDEKYRIYPWGDKEPDEHTANWDKTGLEHPSPVGIFPLDQTEEVVYDMAGNVWEWCLDWKDVLGDADKSLFYEQSDGSTDPLNDKTGKWGVVGKTGARVVRGGAWFNVVEWVLRCCFRNLDGPADRGPYCGFRLVRSAT